MNRKILQGHIENRTKEVALVAVMLALFFIARNLKIQVTPHVGFSFAPIIIQVTAAIVSWPYTILLSFAPLYRGSSPLAVIGWFAGTQATFFLTKLVRKRSPLIPVIGDLVVWVVYGMVFQIVGLMGLGVFLTSSIVPQILCTVSILVGAPLVWKSLEVLNCID